ncbi:MAG: RidA family protein [Acidobacteriota bacterium]|nr:MAG: RidA family protein [Acidobacteriota bacterium]
MTIRRVTTESAPAAIGPYSQAMVGGGLVFCSGQIAIDPETGRMVGVSVTEQTRQALANLAAVLEAAGCGLDRVVKTTVYLESMDQFGAMNEVYEQVFASHKPARAAVEVSALPKGALVEIDAIALRGD